MQRLKVFAVDSGFWIDRIDFENYVSEGAEQRVYLRDSKQNKAASIAAS